MAIQSFEEYKREQGRLETEGQAPAPGQPIPPPADQAEVMSLDDFKLDEQVREIDARIKKPPPEEEESLFDVGAAARAAVGLASQLRPIPPVPLARGTVLPTEAGFLQREATPPLPGIPPEQAATPIPALLAIKDPTVRFFKEAQDKALSAYEAIISNPSIRNSPLKDIIGQTLQGPTSLAMGAARVAEVTTQLLFPETLADVAGLLQDTTAIVSATRAGLVTERMAVQRAAEASKRTASMLNQLDNSSTTKLFMDDALVGKPANQLRALADRANEAIKVIGETRRTLEPNISPQASAFLDTRISYLAAIRDTATRAIAKPRPPSLAEVEQMAQSLMLKKSSAVKRLDSAIGKVPEVQSPLETSSIKAQLVDKYAPLQSLVEASEKATGKAVGFDHNPYNAARLYAGHAGIVETWLEGVRTAIAPVRAETKNLSRVMTAQRMVERSRRGFKNPVGITERTALKGLVEIRSALGPQKFLDLEISAGQIREVGNSLLDEMVDAQILTTKQTSAIKSKNLFWTPFDVVEKVADAEEAVMLGRRALSVGRQDVVKGLVGTEKQILDPLEAVVRRITKSVGLIERNRIMLKLDGLADSVPGLVIRDPKIVPRGFKKLSYFREGRRRELAVPREVADSVLGMNQFTADVASRFAQFGAAALRAGVTTFNLPFILISNPIRDFTQAALTTGRGVGFFSDWASGFAEALNRGDLYKEFLRAGGGQSGIIGATQSTGFIRQRNVAASTARRLTESQATRFAKTVLNPIELMKAVGETFELAPRLGAFKLAKAAGASSKEAALFGRNVTVDFSRVGTVGQIINMFVPFLNARLQGTIITLNAIKKNPATSAYVLGQMVAFPAMASYLYNNINHPELWADIPESEKENNFIFITGTGTDPNGNTAPAYYRIPKSDVARIFGNPIEVFMDWMVRDKPVEAQKLFVQIMSGVSPIDFERRGKIDGLRAMGSALPPWVKAPAEHFTNTSFFTGSPLIPVRRQGIDPELQFIPGRTSPNAVWLGQKMGVSPIILENYVRSMFGELGLNLLNPARAATSFKERLFRVRGGEGAREVHEFREEDRRGKRNLGVMVENAMIDVIAGNNPRDAQIIINDLMPKLEPDVMKRGQRYREILERVMDRKLPSRERALKMLTDDEERRFKIREAVEEQRKRRNQ